MIQVGCFEVEGRIPFVANFLATSHFKNKYLVLTLLLSKGACKVTDKNKNIVSIQNYDLTILGRPKSNAVSVREYINKYSMLTTISPEFYINDKLYRFIFLELCAFISYQKMGNGVLAFLHGYRALEKISYALPLIYTRRTKDFSKTYSQLQIFFTSIDKSAGELAFFKAALNELLESYERRYTFTYPMAYSEKRALQVCLNKYGNKIREVSGVGIELDVNLVESIELFIDMRNKFFHALSGKDHLDLEKLTNPESTFLLFTNGFLNILCFLLGKFIEPSSVQS